MITTAILWCALSASANDISITQVTGPDAPGAYRHPASITELDDGDLYVAYYGGSGEYGVDTGVYGTRLKKGSKRWTKPVAIADTPFESDGNPVVWQAPDGIVWLFYVNRPGETWSESRIKGKVSMDGAKTWSDSITIAYEQGMMVRGRPIVLNDGDYLLPIYHETGHDREHVGADTTSLFLRINPKTKKWTETNRITSRLGNLQPSAVQISDDYLIAYSRRGGGYEPRPDSYLVRSESRDGGRTWSEGKETEFPNPNAATDFIKLRNGHLLLVYNDSKTERTPLTAAISTDNDKTYPYKRNIISGENGDFAYPVAIQTRDGKILVLFTSHARTVVNLAVFDESAILSPPVK